MKKETETTDQISAALFIVIPGIILSKLSAPFADNSLNQYLFAGLFGAVGGILGAGLLQLVKTKTTIVRIFSLTLLTGLCVGTLILVTKLNKPILLTCDICGYVAVSSEREECSYCGNVTWVDEKTINDYNEKKEWIKSEQLFWFSLDSVTQTPDFYEPTFTEGFYKDKNWKPIITKQDLISDFNNKE